MVYTGAFFGLVVVESNQASNPGGLETLSEYFTVQLPVSFEP